MLDEAITLQLRTYLERLDAPIELVAALDDSPTAAEIRALIDELVALSPKLTARDAAADEWVCDVVREDYGDDAPAATRTQRTLRPLDAGQLSNAAPIEAFAAVLLQLNIRYKTRAAVKFTGI